MYSFLCNDTFPVLVVPVSYKYCKYQTVYKNVKSIYSEHIVNI